jgi:hypothetical protein
MRWRDDVRIKEEEEAVRRLPTVRRVKRVEAVVREIPGIHHLASFLVAGIKVQSALSFSALPCLRAAHVSMSLNIQKCFATNSRSTEILLDG